MLNFWDFRAWGSFNLLAALLTAMLAANVLKRKIKFLQASLIPTSVLGGGILIAIAGTYKLVTGNIMFDEPFFGENGTMNLELLTYHCLALGFIASTFKTSDNTLNKKRAAEIFNTGVTTVSTYLLQGILGLGISMVACIFMKDFFEAAGVLLPFGYGQGTGQAMNYGTIYETEFGFVGGKSFGLTIAALGFISASLGGVIYLNRPKMRKKLVDNVKKKDQLNTEMIERENEIPMQESMDKMTFQIALIATAYLLSYLLMFLLGMMLPGMKSVIFGFNFLLGVLAATIVKASMKIFRKWGWNTRDYTNNFLMTRASNFFFDLMVVAGIAAIRLGVLQNYWGIILIMGLSGAFLTYRYNRLVAKVLFTEYREEQFLAMYGMLTGTASTGVILLREIDGDFKTPAADNMVYQNFPAIVFGFPMMLLATLAPVKPMLTLIIFIAFFAVMNIILFRSKIFKKLSK